MRKYKKYKLTKTYNFTLKLLHWLNADNNIAFLNPNHLDKKYGTYDLLCGYGAANEFYAPQNDVTAQFKHFVYDVNDWLFGFFSYDLKNELEHLTSENPDNIQMPLIHFFQPRLVFLVKKDVLEIGYLKKYHSEKDIDGIFKTIIKTPQTPCLPLNNNFDEVTHRVDKETYIKKINNIKKHIQQGDIYEMNYCMEFFTYFKNKLDVRALYEKLNSISPAPFSCLYSFNEKALICASPERFLKKTGNKLISQPIKGTIKRGNDAEEDKMLAQKLSESEKDKSENVMIVDLVRNDLSHYAQKASVVVEELFGIYSFAQVHQMVSTVSCTLRQDACAIDALLKCFPPGSMTGAPKIRAMQIIEATESTKRGLYSGAVGYITPEKDFDFNVVIRSILLNNEKKYASLMAGGAITAKSIAADEYEECLIKAIAMNKALKADA